MEVELGQEQVDFDVHNNHLILDCSHQCNNCIRYTCNHHNCNHLHYTMILNTR